MGLRQAAADAPVIMKWKVKYRGRRIRHGGTTCVRELWIRLFRPSRRALEGRFVHDRDEAEYFSTYEDGDAHLLDGKNDYVLHFNKAEIPPTLHLGFWSITMYGSDFQLVKNPINRFSIGDRTKGIVFGKDGSLDTYVQNAAPQGKESNWLPCPPSGLFRLNYRIYSPDAIARDPKRWASSYRHQKSEVRDNETLKSLW